MTGPLDRLLGQAVAIARDAAIGETTVEPVIVALPDPGAPVPLFIETDEEPEGLTGIDEATEAFLEALGVRRWIRIAADLPAGTIVCTAADGDRRATAILQSVRDAAGIITALADVTPLPGPAGQVDGKSGN